MRRSQYVEDVSLAVVCATAMVFGEVAVMHMAARIEQAISHLPLPAPQPLALLLP